MQIHELKSSHLRKKAKTIGRGGKRGKTSGKGTKGQRARAGHRIRPEIRDVIKKLPKLRGRGVNALKSLGPYTHIVNLNDIERFESGTIINPKTLGFKGVVKILGDGQLTKKLTIEKCLVSKSARVKIERAGGTII